MNELDYFDVRYRAIGVIMLAYFVAFVGTIFGLAMVGGLI